MRPNAAAGAARFRFENRPIAAIRGTPRRTGHDFSARGAGGFVWNVDGRSKTIWGLHSPQEPISLMKVEYRFRANEVL